MDSVSPQRAQEGKVSDIHACAAHSTISIGRSEPRLRLVAAAHPAHNKQQSNTPHDDTCRMTRKKQRRINRY